LWTLSVVRSALLHAKRMSGSSALTRFREVPSRLMRIIAKRLFGRNGKASQLRSSSHAFRSDHLHIILCRPAYGPVRQGVSRWREQIKKPMANRVSCDKQRYRQVDGQGPGRGGSALFPSDRSRCSAWRCEQSACQTRLATQDQLRHACRRHGASGHG
jgi:hypothetical protein